MDPTSFNQIFEPIKNCFIAPLFFLLLFADILTFVENISHTGPRENTFFGIWDPKKDL